MSRFRSTGPPLHEAAADDAEAASRDRQAPLTGPSAFIQWPRRVMARIAARAGVGPEIAWQRRRRVNSPPAPFEGLDWAQISRWARKGGLAVLDQELFSGADFMAKILLASRLQLKDICSNFCRFWSYGRFPEERRIWM